MAKVKTLSGFLPICASGKKIRDDQGSWRQIEADIRDHSEAEFSHGLCPECKEKLYGKFLEEGNKKEENWDRSGSGYAEEYQEYSPLAAGT